MYKLRALSEVCQYFAIFFSIREFISLFGLIQLERKHFDYYS